MNGGDRRLEFLKMFAVKFVDGASTGTHVQRRQQQFIGDTAPADWQMKIAHAIGDMFIISCIN